MRLNVEAISGVLGSVSIVCWVVVFSPQIIENFRRSSADGLSIAFIVIWLFGDIFNIMGAVLQKLLPTMIILAVYYTLADIVLLGQCLYYRRFSLKDGLSSAEDETSPTTETSTLLARRDQSGYLTAMDGAQSSPVTHHHDAKDSEDAKKTTKVGQKGAFLKSVLFNATMIVVVFIAGALGWYISARLSRAHARGGNHRHNASRTPRQRVELNVLGQLFGYICTALYLGSRIPQLLLNYRRKSTEGISMLFFIFACLGNLTYVFSILFFEPICDEPRHCKSEEYASLYIRNVLVNLPWLLGSIGNLLQDAAVFVQYFIYRSSHSH